jgi:hypothetical protein
MNSRIETKSIEKANTGRRSQPIVFPTPKVSASASAPKTSSQAAAAILTAFYAKKIGKRLALLLLVVFLAGIAGCGSSQDPNRLQVFPAKGQIAFPGKPVGGAFVVLHPKAATGSQLVRPRGNVREDGTFSLTTYDANDGAPAGEYKVTVELHNLVKRANGDVSLGPNIVPKQYGNPKTSPLTVRIAEGENSLPPIMLK